MIWWTDIQYKKWNEKTVTSIHSGRHLGHLHAIFRAFIFSNDEYYNKMCHKRSAIIQLHFLMLVIAAKNKYVYDRWKRIVTQMIEKDPGCSKLCCLRVIHLYECDLNLLIGLYFRKLQQHIEDINLLKQGCYGWWPNRRAIDPVVCSGLYYTNWTCYGYATTNYSMQQRFNTIFWPHPLSSCPNKQSIVWTPPQHCNNTQ